MLSLIRCFGCNREIQTSVNKYYELIAKGYNKKYALDHCGVPTTSLFSSDKEGGLPPICCRSIIMTTVDASPSHSIYQFAVSWGEGMDAIGGNSGNLGNASNNDNNTDEKSNSNIK